MNLQSSHVQPTYVPTTPTSSTRATIAYLLTTQLKTPHGLLDYSRHDFTSPLLPTYDQNYIKIPLSAISRIPNPPQHHLHSTISPALQAPDLNPTYDPRLYTTILRQPSPTVYYPPTTKPPLQLQHIPLRLYNPRTLVLQHTYIPTASQQPADSTSPHRSYILPPVLSERSEP